VYQGDSVFSMVFTSAVGFQLNFYPGRLDCGLNGAVIV